MRISISRYLYTRNQRDTFRRNDIAMAFCRVTTISRKDRSRFDRCKIDTRVEKKLFEHTTIKLNGLLHSSSTYVYTEAKTVSPIHLSIWRSSVSCLLCRDLLYFFGRHKQELYSLFITRLTSSGWLVPGGYIWRRRRRFEYVIIFCKCCCLAWLHHT